MNHARVRIECWDGANPRWNELRAFVVPRENTPHAMADDDPVPFFASVALGPNAELLGYLIFLVQPIGPEMDVPGLKGKDGQALTEAKVRAFRVEEAARNQGIGTRLQQATLVKAAELGCFQVRSRSASDRVENYAIKIKLGFAAHPHQRVLKDGSVRNGVYWVKQV